MAHDDRMNPNFVLKDRPQSRPGTATLTVGRESVTLDPLLPQEEFDRRKARWDELAKRAFKP